MQKTTDDLVARLRVVHASKMYVVLYRGNLGLFEPTEYQNTNKVVLHVVNGVVDTLAVFDSFVVGNAHLFELEGATRTFARLSLDEAVRLGAHILHFRAGKYGNNMLLLGISLYTRRGGELARVEPSTEYHMVHHYPDTRLVVTCNISWDSFEGQPTPEQEDQDETLVLQRTEYDTVLGRAVDTLGLAMRTYRG